MIYGYASFLENEQKLNEIIASLNKEVHELYVETATDKKTIQQNLNHLFSKLKNGDVFVIGELNQLNRTIIQLYLLLDSFEKKNIFFVSLKEKIDTRYDKNFVNYLKSLVQMDKNVTSKRAKDAMRREKKKGRQIGRKPIPDKKIEQAIKMYYENEVTIKEIEKITGISRTSLYKYIRLKKIERGEP